MEGHCPFWRYIGTKERTMWACLLRPPHRRQPLSVDEANLIPDLGSEGAGCDRCMDTGSNRHPSVGRVERYKYQPSVTIWEVRTRSTRLGSCWDLMHLPEIQPLGLDGYDGRLPPRQGLRILGHLDDGHIVASSWQFAPVWIYCCGHKGFGSTM